MARTIQARGDPPRQGSQSVTWRCGFRAALFWAMAMLCVGAEFGVSQDEKRSDPPPIVLTRAMIDNRDVTGLEIVVGERSHDTLHVTVIYARNDLDHLGRASLEFRDADRISLKLPVRIVTDKEGRDRLVFSVSASMAEFCYLRLDILPRESEQAVPAASRVYTMELTELIDTPPQDAANS